MIKIITDSTAYTPREYAQEHDISIIPLHYLYKNQEFVEGMPGEFDQFFKDFTESKVFPKTSQPSVELFIDEYNKQSTKATKFWFSQFPALFPAATTPQILQKINVKPLKK